MSLNSMFQKSTSIFLNLVHSFKNAATVISAQWPFTQDTLGGCTAIKLPATLLVVAHLLEPELDRLVGSSFPDDP